MDMPTIAYLSDEPKRHWSFSPEIEKHPYMRIPDRISPADACIGSIKEVIRREMNTLTGDNKADAEQSPAVNLFEWADHLHAILERAKDDDGNAWRELNWLIHQRGGPSLDAIFDGLGEAIERVTA